MLLILTHLFPMHPFYTPWKHQANRLLLIQPFSGRSLRFCFSFSVGWQRSDNTYLGRRKFTSSFNIKRTAPKRRLCHRFFRWFSIAFCIKGKLPKFQKMTGIGELVCIKATKNNDHGGWSRSSHSQYASYILIHDISILILGTRTWFCSKRGCRCRIFIRVDV